MPLSEDEQRLLRQLEQSLAADDPEFASTLSGSKFAARNRRVFSLALIGAVLGLGVVFLGALTAQTYLGIGGFVLMVVSAYFAFTAWGRGVTGEEDGDGSPVDDRGPAPREPKPKGSFIERMEGRWNRRRGDEF